MSVTPEELAAYADGELPEARAAEVGAAIAADPDLARQLEAHRALKGLLSAHYDPIAAQPVPDRLADLLRAAPAAEQPAAPAVVDFAAARAARDERQQVRRTLPGWGWMGGAAIAASLALVALVNPFGGSRASYAEGEVARLLDTGLTGAPPQAGEGRILLSFANAGDELCRAYAAPGQSGIACRDGKGWRIERKAAGAAGDGTDYRQAGSAEAELMAAAQDMAKGAALDAAQEQAAKARGWR